MSDNSCSPFTYAELNKTLENLGIKDDPDWVGVVLFARNLVFRMDMIDQDQKSRLQKMVLDALQKRDFSREKLDRLVQHIQASFADAVKHEMNLMAQKLNNEQKFNDRLITQIQGLVSEFKKSVNRQSNELNDFGKKTISDIELQKDPEQIISYIKGTISKIVKDARSEASNWENRARNLEDIAKYDNLLKNLFNRSFFDDFLARSVPEHHKSGRPLSLLMIDVDHFKKINDRLGHLIGDDVLKALAKLIRKLADAQDGVPCRYGGEELCIIFQNKDEQTAWHQAEKLRKEVETYNFVPREPTGRIGDAIHFTISIGVAELKKDDSPSDLISSADKALYRAKDNGRNKVEKFSEL
ncbi:MAG: GGDEF domain-containing protein [Desulfonatronovibrionaceae bacterium]